MSAVSGPKLAAIAVREAVARAGLFFGDCFFCWGVRREFGWVGFLVVCFLHKTNPQPTKTDLLWEKVAQIPLLTYHFLGWVGLGLGSSTVSQ